jgi:serine/threonine protein kinase
MNNPPSIQFLPPIPGETISHNNRLFTIGIEIGRGSFGIVYEYFDNWGNELAAKVFLPYPNRDVRAMWERELSNLINLRNPFITFIYDAFEYKGNLFIITERCHLTLKGLLEIPNYNGNIWIKPIARCLLQAVDFLHSIGFVHKDIHPGNVFTSIIKDEIIPKENNALTFKLGDLGITNLLSNMDVFNTILAPWMLPPEY